MEVAAEVFGWVSAVCFGALMVPQIVTNFKRKTTSGVSIAMMVMWAATALPFSAYLYFEEEPVALWITQGIVTSTFLVIISQWILYDKSKSVLAAVVVGVLMHAAAVGLVFGCYHLYKTTHDVEGVKWVPPVLGGIVPTVALAVGYIPQLRLIFKNKHTVGFARLFLLLDFIGAIASILSVVLSDSSNVEPGAVMPYVCILTFDIVLVILCWVYPAIEPAQVVPVDKPSLGQRCRQGSTSANLSRWSNSEPWHERDRKRTPIKRQSSGYDLRSNDQAFQVAQAHGSPERTLTASMAEAAFQAQMGMSSLTLPASISGEGERPSLAFIQGSSNHSSARSQERTSSMQASHPSLTLFGSLGSESDLHRAADPSIARVRARRGLNSSDFEQSGLELSPTGKLNWTLAMPQAMHRLADDKEQHEQVVPAAGVVLGSTAIDGAVGTAPTTPRAADGVASTLGSVLGDEDGAIDIQLHGAPSPLLAAVAEGSVEQADDDDTAAQAGVTNAVMDV